MNSINKNPIYNSNFDVYLSNVEKVEEAQVICIPQDDDSIPYDDSGNTNLRIAWLINKLYRKGDLVLVKSSLKKMDQRHCYPTSKVSRSIDVIGWDINGFDAKMWKLRGSNISMCDIKDVIQLQPLLKLKVNESMETSISQLFSTKSLTSKEALNLLKIKIDELPSPEHQKDEFRKTLKKALEEPDNSDMQGIWAELIAYYLQLENKKSKVWEDAFLDRQKSMIEKCETACLPGRRVFILCSKKHLLKHDAQNKELSEIMKEGVKNLHDYLETKKFIIFDHKVDVKVSQELRDDLRKERVTHKVIRIVCIIFCVLLFPLFVPSVIFAQVYYSEKYYDFNSWLERPFKIS